jgi:hypothetical protein
MVAIEAIKYSGRRLLSLLKINRAVIVGVESIKRIAT